MARTSRDGFRDPRSFCGRLDVLSPSGCGRFRKSLVRSSRALEEAGRRWLVVTEGDEQITTLPIA